MEKKKKVRFTNKNRSNFLNTVRARVDQYFIDKKISKHANAEMVAKTVILLSAYLLPYIVIISFNLPTWAVVTNCVLMGFAMAGIGMSVMHDANHNAYSANQTTNKWIGYSLCLAGGAVFNWKIQHNLLHHTYTNIAGLDDDIDSKLAMRFSPHSDKKWYHRFQHIYVFAFYSILTLYWVTLKDFVQLIKYRAESVNNMSRREYVNSTLILIASKVIYFFFAFVIPCVFLNYSFSTILIGFLVMHSISGLVLSVIFQLAHTVEHTTHPLPNEKLEVDNEWAIHQMNTTVNFSRYNRFISWYVGGLNFQVEHHLFPTICHVHYRPISEIVKSTAEEFGIEYLDNPTFWGAVGSHIRVLKHFGNVEKSTQAQAA
jgi:linoleoyl-CoA desaturase